jgi:hypothetical protein
LRLTFESKQAGRCPDPPGPERAFARRAKPLDLKFEGTLRKGATSELATSV